MSNDLQTARSKYVAELKNTLKTIETEGRTLQQDFDKKFSALKARHAEVQRELAQFEGTSTKKAAPKKSTKKAASPKKATKKAAKKAAAPKAKAAPKKTSAKSKAKKTAKKAAKKSTKTKKAPKKAKSKSKAAAIAAATKGRRAVAEGLRPPLKEAIATVMGKKTMDAGQVIDGLKKRGWMPDAEDERGYISYALSSNKTVFERVKRGFYKVREGVTFAKRQAAPKAKAKTGKKAAAKTTAPAPTTTPEDQKTLQSVGVGEGNNVQANPFV